MADKEATSRLKRGKTTTAPQRKSGAEAKKTANAVAPELAVMPEPRAEPAPVAAPVKFEQITFKCSPTMADTLFSEGQKVGGLRVIIAQALKNMGLTVSDEDLSPRELRRTNRRQRISV